MEDGRLLLGEPVVNISRCIGFCLRADRCIGYYVRDGYDIAWLGYEG